MQTCRHAERCLRWALRGVQLRHNQARKRGSPRRATRWGRNAPLRLRQEPREHTASRLPGPAGQEGGARGALHHAFPSSLRHGRRHRPSARPAAPPHPLERPLRTACRCGCALDGPPAATGPAVVPLHRRGRRAASTELPWCRGCPPARAANSTLAPRPSRSVTSCVQRRPGAAAGVAAHTGTCPRLRLWPYGSDGCSEGRNVLQGCKPALRSPLHAGDLSTPRPASFWPLVCWPCLAPCGRLL